jgi:NADH:ubiquinone oxidoreductase subunit 3 (subunit A)
MEPKFGLLWGVLVVIGLFLFVVPGVLIFILRLVSCFKKKKIWKEAYAAYEKGCAEAKDKRSALLSKAQALV